ncbi:MAG: Flp family type IVb pilin [Hyphomicrobiales bacterium]
MAGPMRFWKADRRATAVEYALIAAGMAVAIITVLLTIGDQLCVIFAETPKQPASRDPVIGESVNP